jgi:SET domain-containing protein
MKNNNYSNTINYRIDCPEEYYLYVKASQIEGAGKGLFTAIKIFKDEIISVFKGELLTATEIKKRIKNNADAYFINMVDGRIMDCMNTGCFAKYANDAKGIGKSEFKNNSVISLDEQDNVCIVATKTIKAGEEIFCSYGKRYWEKYAN